MVRRAVTDDGRAEKIEVAGGRRISRGGARRSLERYVHHVTLDTGHVRQSPRSEVSDDAVAMLQPLLERVLSGEHVPIAGLTMNGTAEDGACIVTLSQTGVPVVTIGIASHSRGGALLWPVLHQSSPLAAPRTSPEQIPPEPWCATRLQPGVVLITLDELLMLGDIERCLAWAWIDR